MKKVFFLTLMTLTVAMYSCEDLHTVDPTKPPKLNTVDPTKTPKP
jgi:hypothetical protein